METLNPSRTSENWSQVVNDFRRVCFLKREGKTQESESVLTVDLPKSIALWSREEKRDGQTQRQALQEMFTQEERRVDDVWQLKSLLRDQLKTELMDQLKADLRVELDAERKRFSEQLAQWTATQAPPPAPAIIPEVPAMASEAAPVFEAVAEPVPTLPAPARVIRPWKPQAMEMPARHTPPPPPPAPEPQPRRRPPLNDLAAVLDFVLAEQPEMARNEHSHAAVTY